MECLALALKNGGATPTGSDLFHYHLDKRIRIETVEGKCQRHCNDASAGRGKNTSMMLARGSKRDRFDQYQTWLR